VQGCVLRPLCAGDSQKQPLSKGPPRAFLQVNPVLWAWLDLNQRPHPYQVSRAKRCADRRFPRSPLSVRGQGMRSNWPLHATRQVHDDVQLAGYTWILLAGVRDATWSPWPAPPSSCRAWMDEFLPAASYAKRLPSCPGRQTGRSSQGAIRAEAVVEASPWTATAPVPGGGPGLRDRLDRFTRRPAMPSSPRL
jgi:hypothetical protein